METVIILERLQPNAGVFITLINNKCSTPFVLLDDILECRAEFMKMSEMRTGHKEYVVEPNGHMVIKDFTKFN